MKERNFENYFIDILNSIKEIEDFIKGMSYSNF